MINASTRTAAPPAAYASGIQMIVFEKDIS